jgi:uncharacterized phage-associated protein
MPLSFSYRKATQALNFFARQDGGTINKMRALKLLFFADRYHLRKYGRPIANDEYFAMDYGPVPSGAKDLAESSDFRPDVEKVYAGQFIAPSDDRLSFKSVASVDEVVFSHTDLEALRFAWGMFHGCKPFELAELTHAYPEWKKHEAALKSGVNSRVKMRYLDFLDDPPPEINPCHPLSGDERAVRADEVREMNALHALWN